MSIQAQSIITTKDVTVEVLLCWYCLLLLVHEITIILLIIVNRTLDALQASATQVRLEPDSEAAKRNAVFYQQRPGVTRKDFLPREVRRGVTYNAYSGTSH